MALLAWSQMSTRPKSLRPGRTQKLSSSRPAIPGARAARSAMGADYRRGGGSLSSLTPSQGLAQWRACGLRHAGQGHLREHGGTGHGRRHPGQAAGAVRRGGRGRASRRLPAGASAAGARASAADRRRGRQGRGRHGRRSRAALSRAGDARSRHAGSRRRRTAPPRRSRATGRASIRIVSARHPTPGCDERRGGRAVRWRWCARRRRDDLVLVLLSGGASALWAAPAAGLDLAARRR